MTDAAGRLTEADRVRLSLILTKAREDGKDPIEELNKTGLILTERRFYQLRTEAMEELINLLDRTPAHHLLQAQGVVGNLAEDYRKALVAHLTELWTMARGKWFR